MELDNPERKSRSKSVDLSDLRQSVVNGETDSSDVRASAVYDEDFELPMGSMGFDRRRRSSLPGASSWTTKVLSFRWEWDGIGRPQDKQSAKPKVAPTNESKSCKEAAAHAYLSEAPQLK